MSTQSPSADSRITDATVPATPEAVAVAGAEAEPEAEEILIEEISIDGMCGVY